MDVIERMAWLYTCPEATYSRALIEEQIGEAFEDAEYEEFLKACMEESPQG